MKATIKPMVKQKTATVPVMGKINTVQQAMSGREITLPYSAKEKSQTNQNTTPGLFALCVDIRRGYHYSYASVTDNGNTSRQSQQIK